MKRISLAILTILLLNCSNAICQEKYSSADTTLKSLDNKKAEQAKNLVRDYVRIIFKGENIDSLVNICSIPFAWDKKKIIDNWNDFLLEQNSIVTEKGKNRELVIDSIYIKAIREEILDKVIPLKVYYVIIKIKVKRNEKVVTSGAMFAVQITEAPRIIGVYD